MSSEVVKVEAESSCCVCGAASDELCSPEEYDAAAPPPAGRPPLRAVLLHLNHTKVVPNGRLCGGCIRRALEAYEFSTMLAAKGPPPLSEKIRALRKRLHELTQKIDVFIVVGGGAGGSYSEDDIIAVERSALAAAHRADRADRAELLRATNMRGDQVYQCTVCPHSFQRASEYRAHASQHAAGALHSCWACGAQFPSAARAAEHAADHRPRAAVCHLCGDSFQSTLELRRHEASPACPARCPCCGVQCASRAALRAHAAAHPALCAACLLLLPSAAARAAHALAHRQARQLVCGYDGCILRFANRSNLLSHIRKCHAESVAAEEAPPAPSACTVCGRVFASATALKRHSRVHKSDNSAATLHQHQEDMEWGSELDGKVEYLEVETLDDGDDPQHE